MAQLWGRTIALEHRCDRRGVLKSPPAGGHSIRNKYLESYDYNECTNRMRSRHLQEVVERFCELFQAGCGVYLFR